MISHIYRLAIVAALSGGSLLATGDTASAQAIGSFFRQSDRPEVYYQFRADMHCHVQNEAQMAAYGGFGRVQVVPRASMRGQFTGGCSFPNGFYRYRNRPEVYRLFGSNGLPNGGNDICHVVNEQQMARFGGFGIVRVVPDSSDIGRGRGQVRPCIGP